MQRREHVAFPFPPSQASFVPGAEWASQLAITKGRLRLWRSSAESRSFPMHACFYKPTNGFLSFPKKNGCSFIHMIWLLPFSLISLCTVSSSPFGSPEAAFTLESLKFILFLGAAFALESFFLCLFLRQHFHLRVSSSLAFIRFSNHSIFSPYSHFIFTHCIGFINWLSENRLLSCLTSISQVGHDNLGL